MSFEEQHAVIPSPIVGIFKDFDDGQTSGEDVNITSKVALPAPFLQDEPVDTGSEVIGCFFVIVGNLCLEKSIHVNRDMVVGIVVDYHGAQSGWGNMAGTIRFKITAGKQWNQARHRGGDCSDQGIGRRDAHAIRYDESCARRFSVISCGAFEIDFPA